MVCPQRLEMSLTLRHKAEEGIQVPWPSSLKLFGKLNLQSKICGHKSGHPASRFLSLRVPFGHSYLLKAPQEAWALYRLGKEVASMTSVLQGTLAGFISKLSETGKEVSSAHHKEKQLVVQCLE